MDLLHFVYIRIDSFRFCFIYMVKQLNAFDLDVYLLAVIWFCFTKKQRKALSTDIETSQY